MTSDPTQPHIASARDSSLYSAPDTPLDSPFEPAPPPLTPPTPAEQARRHAEHVARIAAVKARIAQLRKDAASRKRRGTTRAARAPSPPAAAPAMVRSDRTAPGWTPDKQRAFLEHLASHGCVSHAAAYVGLSKQSAYAPRHRGGRTMFALAWDVAVRAARKALLDEAIERAFTGRAAAVWYRGEQVGERIVHNDRLLMQLLAHKFDPINSAHDEETLAQA